MAEPLSGGDIHHTLRLVASDGRQWVLKYNTGQKTADIFRTEAQGLALLGASRAIATPKVYAQGSIPEGWSFLLMEFIRSGYKNLLFWEHFGHSLANLHGNTAAQFGFAHDNFIGSLQQSNRRHDSWAVFFAEERLLPQMARARAQKRLSAADENALQRICTKLSMLCPEEAPALIHGDLWSGNFLCNTAGQAVLIDPAACFAHREMDLAMSRLFGGFDAAFYRAYNKAWPLEPGFEERLEVYQLYYLLVHVNLFGDGYVESVRGILRRFS